jgi:DNA-binding MarR family transcriptional regulator
VTRAENGIRWLSADEQVAWRTFLFASRLVHERLERQLQHDSCLPHAYYEVLVQLSEAPGRALRMNELAARSQYSRSRLSHAVSRLEAAGWVRREASPDDARGQLAVLTDEGFERLAAAAPGHVEEVRRVLFDPLTAEQVEQLRAISAAILTAAGEDLPQPPVSADA